MSKTSFREDSHYVPHLYIKSWSSSHKRVWTYRVLVSHDRVPLWKESSIRGIAYHAHLYTGIVAGEESDEIEKWLDREFESPAAEPLEKAISDRPLTASDWIYLARFVAAQDVRTPARLMENLKRWTKILPGLIENTLKDAVRELELARETGQAIPAPKTSKKNAIPFRLTTEIEPGQKLGKLKGETIAGRGLWLFGIRHLLTQTVNVLTKHRWTILKAPAYTNWFTSDDPVIRLNFHNYDKYDFQGGWGSPGTEIMLPLSPQHLLYTQVGKRPPQRGEILRTDRAAMIRRFIAEHAHRMIFAKEKDNDVPKLRPRIVNPQLFKDEEHQWHKWHEEQTAAEIKLKGV